MTNTPLVQSPTSLAELAAIQRAARRGRPRLTQEQKCGTTTGYAQGCRCVRCKAAVAEYQRNYQARPEVIEQRAVRELLRTPEGREALDRIKALATIL